MKRLLILLLFVAPLVFAQVPRTVTIERATERMNGDPLPLDEIAWHDIQCHVQGSEEPLFTIEGPAAGGATATPAVFVDGQTYVCQARTIDTGGRASPTWSVSAPFTVGRCEVSDCRPAPPKSVVIVIQ